MDDVKYSFRPIPNVIGYNLEDLGGRKRLVRALWPYKKWPEVSEEIRQLELQNADA